jgi:hypothetical protein
MRMSGFRKKTGRQRKFLNGTSDEFDLNVERFTKKPILANTIDTLAISNDRNSNDMRSH